MCDGLNNGSIETGFRFVLLTYILGVILFIAKHKVWPYAQRFKRLMSIGSWPAFQSHLNRTFTFNLLPFLERTDFLITWSCLQTSLRVFVILYGSLAILNFLNGYI